MASFPAHIEGVGRSSNHLLRAGEGKENEKTLESVEGDESIPEALNIQVAGYEAHGPRETHDEG